MAGSPRNVIYFESSDPPGPGLTAAPYTDVILAFVHVHDGPALYLNDTPLDQVPPAYWAGVQALQAAGKRVLVSVGGWGVGDWRAIAKDVDGSAKVLADMLLARGFDGIDLDWEDWNSPPYDPTQLLTQLILALGAQARQAGATFLVTLAPVQPMMVSAYAADYRSIDENTNGLVSWFNVQMYEGGGAFTESAYAQMVQAGWDPAILLPGAEPQLEGMCPVLATLRAIRAQYPTSPGVFAWNEASVASSWPACAAAALQGQTCATCAGARARHPPLPPRDAV